jgi:hypothetical protein
MIFLTLNQVSQTSSTAPWFQFVFIWLVMSIVLMFITESYNGKEISTRDYLIFLLFWPLLLFIFYLMIAFDAICRLKLWICKRKYVKGVSFDSNSLKDNHPPQ